MCAITVRFYAAGKAVLSGMMHELWGTSWRFGSSLLGSMSVVNIFQGSILWHHGWWQELPFAVPELSGRGRRSNGLEGLNMWNVGDDMPMRLTRESQIAQLLDRSNTYSVHMDERTRRFNQRCKGSWRTHCICSEEIERLLQSNKSKTKRRDRTQLVFVSNREPDNQR